MSAPPLGGISLTFTVCWTAAPLFSVFSFFPQSIPSLLPITQPAFHLLSVHFSRFCCLCSCSRLIAHMLYATFTVAHFAVRTSPAPAVVHCNANQDRVQLNRRWRWLQHLHTVRRINIRWLLGQLRPACQHSRALELMVVCARWSAAGWKKMLFTDAAWKRKRSPLLSVTDSIRISAEGKCDVSWNALGNREVPQWLTNWMYTALFIL